MTALAPDGRRAAFPQRDGLVIVDLTKPSAETVPVPGYNEYVVWLGDRVVVVQAEAALSVDPASGRVTRLPYDGFDLVVSTRPGHETHELAEDPLGRPVLRTWAGSNQPPRSTEITGLVGGARWVGPAWLSGPFIAAESLAPRSASEVLADTVVVLAADDARVHRRLLLSSNTAPDRPVGCCRVLGWLDEHTLAVQVRAAGEHLLAWEVVNGAVTSVSDLRVSGTLAAVSLADLSLQ